MFKRSLKLPKNQTFFLWGPRQTGKTTLLKELFPKSYWLDLLKSDSYRRYAAKPEFLRGEVLADSSIKEIVIDEVQKLPVLLNEVHWLIENKKISFALCGSSARKIKRQGVNLLGGRALKYELYGLTFEELGKDFNIKKVLNYGYLPSIYTHKLPHKALESYVSDYLKEEIAQEALVKNLSPFSQFLEKAALSDTEMLQYSTFARDCGVSSNTIQEYYEILCQTFIGTYIHGYKRKMKRRVIHKPKFYFFDVGVVNLLSKRYSIEAGSPLWGKAFENWVFHELICLKQYQELINEISYWKLSSGSEVDFIIDDMYMAIESKATNHIHLDHLKSLRNIAKEHKVKHKIIVCMEPRKRKTEDGILIVPYQKFIEEVKSLLS